MFNRKVLPNAIIAVLALMFAALAGGAPASVLKATIKEYDVPTPKSRPHDPAAAPDGSLWWTEQLANKLGRLDPKTGTIKEYPLKTPNSGPHGLTSDSDGNIWFTANYAGYIGKLDPKSGSVTEYKIPDARARDPHTPVFDQQGRLWFTVQDSNFVGRLDPKTGKFDLKEVPTPKALPYGMVISSKGVPWFCEFGSNKLASVDPKTMTITEHDLPEGARPRRLAITKDDIIYYSDYARGYLGRYDTQSNKHEEWSSPGGPRSKPYGIAIRPDGAVWYSESGIEPNTLIRFDPKTHEFAEENIPSGGGVVRNMTVANDGNLYLACSGVNKVAVVTP
jgi:virginiamycin B lyase